MKTEQTSLHVSAPKRAVPGGDIRPEDASDLTSFLDFLQVRSDRVISRKTVSTYKEAIVALARHAAGKGMPLLADLTREHVEDFLGSLKARGNRPATIRNRYASLSSFFSWTVAEDIRKDHPMARIPMPRIPEQVMAHYTDEEIITLLAAIPNKATDVLALRDRLLVLTLLDTGVRCQEACDLHLRDIDREARHAHVRAGKGGKGRLVAYSAEVANALNRYLRRRGGWDALGPTAPLFALRNGEAMKVNSVRMLMQRHFAAASLEYRGIHAFRRSAGIGFLEAGGDPIDLKELMGWSSWAMLYRYTKATARSRALRAHEEHSPVVRMMQKERKR